MDEVLANMDMGSVLICPVCRDTYHPTRRYPIGVPCGHTFCSQCALTLIPARSVPVVVCPVCRKRHVGTNTGPGESIPGNFKKNFSLLEVLEKFTEAKEKLDRSKSFVKAVNCRECKKETTEDACTQCDCVKDLSNGELDFMNRPRNLLICIECINNTHKEHQVKPMNIVKAAFDNYKISHDLTDEIAKLRNKAKITCAALLNTKTEIDKLLGDVDETMARISSRPKDALLYCSSSKYLNKLEAIDKTITELGTTANAGLNEIRDYSEFVSSFAAQPRIRDMDPIVERPVERPADAEGDFRLLVRFGNRDGDEVRVEEIARQIEELRQFEIGNADNAQGRNRQAARAVDGFNRMFGNLFRILDGEDPIENEEPNAQANVAVNANNGVVVLDGDAEDAGEVQGNVVEQMQEEEQDAEVVQNVEPARRGRGRPRRNIPAPVAVDVAQPVVNAEEQEEEEPIVRRQRGRPPRHNPIQHGAQNARGNRRGRGRAGRRH